MTKPTIRAQITALRTYHRPKQDGGLETWEDVVDRVIKHQQWLWERALKRDLNLREMKELQKCRELIVDRKICPAGRTLWLGGTEISQTRESSMFNCSFTHVETVHDMVDILWLLMQGCGVGFKPVPGILTGFRNPIHDIQVIRSKRTGKGGRETNKETMKDGVWTISVGDSAASWSKALGKLLAGKYTAHKLILDFSNIRPAGDRLAGYGWICSGDEQIAKAFANIAKILSKKSDRLLTKMDILDIVNYLGTMLSSRRSAQIALFEYGADEWEDFALAKKDFWLHGNDHRQQSNNSLVFERRPTFKELDNIFDMIVEAGGSEPGFINAQAARDRAPWFRGCNPCVEILLGNKSFCNLTEVNLMAFKNDHKGLEQAIYLAARMNYRQTCVDLRDGVLQDTWHQNNEYLRLCGVGLTGIAGRPDLKAYDYKAMRGIATHGAYRMAHELNMPMPKNVTCIKPSGTLSKVMGADEWGEVPEGVHTPLGEYIFNNISFSKHDKIVPILAAAGYKVKPKPFEAESVLITFPVHYKGDYFTTTPDGKKVNNLTAIEQLELYKKLMLNWCDQNVSITVSYTPDEVDAIKSWIYHNWEHYVGVSFLFKADPTKTAKDLGYEYLPQEVVTEETFNEYVETLSKPDLTELFESGIIRDITEDGCQGGHCPIR